MIEVERAIPTFRRPDYAGLVRGGAVIHLGLSDPPITAAFYLQLARGGDDMAADILAAGERILSPLCDRDYGMRDLTIHDPDGNEIYVGQPL